MAIKGGEERASDILRVLVTSYIEKGEPISSEEIASKLPYSVSSATIRAELGKLEAEGFVLQPHVSAGRIPSYRGYRAYVDRLLTDGVPGQKPIPVEIPKHRRLEAILHSISDALSEHTQTVSIVLFPLAQRLKFKSIHLLAIPPNKVLLVVVVNADDIREFILTQSEVPEQHVLDKLSRAMLRIQSNPGWTPIQIYSSMVREIEGFKEYKDLILNTLQLIREVASREVIRMLQEGTHRLIKHPSFSTPDIPHQVMEVISIKETMQDILLDTLTKGDLDIVLGPENNLPELEEVAYIGKPYQVDDAIGVLSLIGPMRMNYIKTFQALNFLSAILEEVLHKQ